MALAYVFPGQGSQYIGMGKDLYDKYPSVRKIFHFGNRILNFDITDLMFNGTKEDIDKTYFSQLAISLSNYAHFNTLKEKGLKPDLFLGHSVGEYTAFLTSGIVSLKSVIEFVKERGTLMTCCIPEKEKPADYTPMAAVFTKTPEAIQETISKHDVEVGNHNLGGQYVLTGKSADIKSAIKYLKEKGVRRSIPLAVEGPWHSRYMTEAKNGLEDFIEKLELKDPKIPYIANLNGELVKTAEQMKAYTPSQVNRTVQWQKSMDNAINNYGIDSIIECGSGNVQEKMISREYPNIKVLKKEDYL